MTKPSLRNIVIELQTGEIPEDRRCELMNQLADRLPHGNSFVGPYLVVIWKSGQFNENHKFVHAIIPRDSLSAKKLNQLGSQMRERQKGFDEKKNTLQKGNEEMGLRGQLGASTNIERTPASSKRKARQRVKQQDYWESKCGETSVREMTPEEIDEFIARRNKQQKET